MPSASRALVAATLLWAVAFARVNATRADEPGWLSGAHVDYAPSGVPDFSQCRGPWSRPGSPGQWTHAAPVALADALWWLDSVAEPDPRPPSVPNDGHALVSAYPYFGPQRDDHAPENLTPLIEDLALRANTNGARTADALVGTRWEDLASAARAYVAARDPAGTYVVETVATPSQHWIADQVAGRASVVLALGVWESQSATWHRIGGHYAALAGADAAEGWVAVSDPLADNAAFGGDGRSSPAEPASHGCREAPRAHDDAAFASHDRYLVHEGPGLPGERFVLQGYFTPETFGDAAAFHGQNPASALEAHAAPWQRGSVVMAVDFALSVRPVSGAPPRATPSPTATATPGTGGVPTRTSTPGATTPTVRATSERPTAVTPPEATSPGPTLTPSPASTGLIVPTVPPLATRVPSRRPALLPWLGR